MEHWAINFAIFSVTPTPYPPHYGNGSIPGRGRPGPGVIRLNKPYFNYAVFYPGLVIRDSMKIQFLEKPFLKIGSQTLPQNFFVKSLGKGVSPILLTNPGL
jgi:hypothetical protein